MVYESEIVFVSVTHGRNPDCQQANSNLRDKLESYRFDAYLLERNCFRCVNETCNLSFIFILRRSEYLRLRKVDFDSRPTFVVHYSLKALVGREKKEKELAIQKNSFGLQVGPQTVNAEVDAVPETRVLYVQTDFMVGKKDSCGQTEIVVSTDMASQTDFEPEITVVSTECSNPDMIPSTPVAPVASPPGNIEKQISPSSLPVLSILRFTADEPTLPILCLPTHPSPIRSLEVQQDDDDEDVVFIEIRPCDSNAPKEVKLEQEETRPLEQELSQREVKEEAVEPEAIGESTVESISNALLSAVLHTPKTSIKSESNVFEQSAKRMRMDNVDICDMCSDVTYFSTLEEYCSHVLEVHVSLCRYKCTICSMMFFKSHIAINHAQKHLAQSEECSTTPEELISQEIPDEHVVKFVRAANKCYPQKFRNVPVDELIEIIQKL